MTGKTPLFITASLLLATLALALPDLDIDPTAEESPAAGSVKDATKPGLVGASRRSSSTEGTP
ncbi:MAG TPA: hypothetical protein VID28_20070 [Methylomirabilota bacterium]|jgi:hypothetical protein